VNPLPRLAESDATRLDPKALETNINGERLIDHWVEQDAFMARPFGLGGLAVP
jgi:hypothetical protein